MGTKLDGKTEQVTLQTIADKLGVSRTTVSNAFGKPDQLTPRLRTKILKTAQEAVVTTTAVQQTLRLAGFWDGPVDGEWTPELTEALEEFQKKLGVKPTGTVDAATIAALEKAIAAAGSQPSGEATDASSTASPPGANSTPSEPTEPATGTPSG